MNHMNHYGKKIDELTSLETELLMIDVMLVKTFERMVTDDIPFKEQMTSIRMGGHLSEMRMEKCREILGNVTQEEVEDSVYSFMGFLKDKRSNTKIFKDEEVEKQEYNFNWN